jgi:hypothetical protein
LEDDMSERLKVVLSLTAEREDGRPFSDGIMKCYDLPRASFVYLEKKLLELQMHLNEVAEQAAAAAGDVPAEAAPAPRTRRS